MGHYMDDVRDLCWKCCPEDCDVWRDGLCEQHWMERNMSMLTYEEVLERADYREEGWEFVHYEMGDTWRWGHYEHYVYRRLPDNKLFMYHVQIVSGDHGPNEGLWEFDDIPDFCEVKAVQSVSYQAVKTT